MIRIAISLVVPATQKGSVVCLFLFLSQYTHVAVCLWACVYTIYIIAYDDDYMVLLYLPLKWDLVCVQLRKVFLGFFRGGGTQTL